MYFNAAKMKGGVRVTGEASLCNKSFNHIQSLKSELQFNKKHTRSHLAHRKVIVTGRSWSGEREWREGVMRGSTLFLSTKSSRGHGVKGDA